MKKKNKIYIILLVVIVLLIVSIPFVPPIYNRYTKPLCKNYVNANKWYGKVDCENLSQVRDYCERRGYSTDYYILVDFSIPSGKKRFFIYDLQHGKRVLSSYCMHGCGKGNTDYDEHGDVLDSMIETGGMTKEEYQAKVKDFVGSL